MSTSRPAAPSRPDVVAPTGLSGRTRGPALALCAWTLFTWITRVPLAWSDDELSSAGKVAATVPVLLFVVLALGTGIAVLRRAAAAPLLLLGFAVWTIGYWGVRITLIAAGGHDAGFVIVHSVLALVASGLAGATLIGLASDGALPGRPRRAAA